MSEPRAMGESITRVDAVEKVTGSARYVADLRLPGMLHMKVLRSTQAHARIAGLKTGRAEGLPGVAAVVTGQGEAVLLGSCIYDQPPMARDRVRHAGEPVAAVVAATPGAAQAAAETIEVAYEPLPVLLNPLIKQALPDINQSKIIIGIYKIGIDTYSFLIFLNCFIK